MIIIFIKEFLVINQMVSAKFKKAMNSGMGYAIIMAGSDSDRDHIDKIVKSLKEYEIPHEVRICSAHKQPKRLMEIIQDYNSVKGLVAYIAVAGGTDALSGTLSYHALGPVISCPPDAPNESCLRNPPGSSNSYIPNPKNVGRHIAQMYAGVNVRSQELLRKKK